MEGIGGRSCEGEGGLDQCGDAVGGPVGIEIVAHPPDARRRDLDNLLKATLDALTAARVWQDDNQVKRIELRWGDKIKGGQLEIGIEEMEA